MLSDRLEHLENEARKVKTQCGDLYKKLVIDLVGDYGDELRYKRLREELTNLTMDIDIVKQMMQDGHK